MAPRFLIAVLAVAALTAGWVPASQRSPRLLYIHGERPYLIRLEAGGARSIAVAHAERYSWSPDGKYILVQSRSRLPILRILNAKGKLVKVLPVPRRNLLAATWDLNSDRVAFATLVSSGRHHRISTSFSVAGLHGGAHLIWPRRAPKKSIPVATGDGLSDFYPSFGDPAVSELKGELLSSEPGLLFSSRLHLLVYTKPVGDSAAAPWRILDTRDGTHRSLPFGNVSGPLGIAGLFSGGPVDQVALSRSGVLAGQIGDRIAILARGRHARPRVVGQGYDPAWSADGRWLYWVSTKKTSRLRFRMRVKEPVIFTCVRDGRLSLRSCPAAHHPYRREWLWQRVDSAANSISVRRIASHEGRATTLFTENAFGIADLNPLDGGSRLIFSQVPSDYGLWLHRNSRNRVDARDAKKFRPYISIQSWTVGSQPALLVDRGHLPSVQPERRWTCNWRVGANFGPIGRDSLQARARPFRRPQPS